MRHRPDGDRRPRGQVLVALPFNEEMNRSRSMVTLLADALATIDVATLVVDLYGTGDSDGEYDDARWAHWLDSLRRADASTADGGASDIVLGIRLGAVLAAQYAAERATSAAGSPRLLALWQPVVDGKQHLTQFFRVRIAAEMDRSDLPRLSTAEMRAQLAQGTPVEVAGYAIHPELAAAIDSASLARCEPPKGGRTLWLENKVGDAAELAPAGAAVVRRWREAGVAVDTQHFDGPAFWQVHERMVAPAAIALTRDWIDRNLPA